MSRSLVQTVSTTALVIVLADLSYISGRDS